jgi:inner membrane protein
MMGCNHAATGVIAGSGVAWLAHLEPGKAVAFIVIVSVSSLLPDMDHPGARLPRALGWPGRVIAWTIGSLFGHRGITHSVVGVGLLSAGLAFTPRLPMFCYVAVILGCVVHILGDMLTVSGVPLLWPLERCYRFGWMRTGGFFETEILTPVLAVLATLAPVALLIGSVA